MKKNPWIIRGIGAIIIVAIGYQGLHLIPKKGTAQSDLTPTPQPSPSPSPLNPRFLPHTSSILIMTKTTSNQVKYLTDSRGMTLYTSDKDKPNISTCGYPCFNAWPPFVVDGPPFTPLPDHIAKFKRQDTSTQYSWDSKPLYFYSLDKAPGDIKGDGVDGTWHIVQMP